MKLQAILLTALMSTVVLAGCTTGEDPDAAVPDGIVDDSFDLGNQGAINGLIVDDNFRPLELREDFGGEPGDFQDSGFILVLETAQRFESNENGEFQVLPLDPGTYTLRIAADRHEAKDTTVNVVAGEFAEVTVEARRELSDGGTVLTQEYVVFIGCAGTFGAAKLAILPGGCGDISGDAERFDFWTDLSSIGNDVKAIVTEAFFSEPGAYGVTIRSFDSKCTDSPCYFVEANIDGEDYSREIMYPGREWTAEFGEYYYEGDPEFSEAGGSGRPQEYDPTFSFQTAVFAEAGQKETTDLVFDPADPYLDMFIQDDWVWTAGIALGIRSQFVQTVFLYELPDEGLDDYCVLCEDAAIPE